VNNGKKYTGIFLEKCLYIFLFYEIVLLQKSLIISTKIVHVYLERWFLMPVSNVGNGIC